MVTLISILLARSSLLKFFALVTMQAHGRHLVRALPSVFTLQCLAGKVDKNKMVRLSNVQIRLNDSILEVMVLCITMSGLNGVMITSSCLD